MSAPDTASHEPRWAWNDNDGIIQIPDSEFTEYDITELGKWSAQVIAAGMQDNRDVYRAATMARGVLGTLAAREADLAAAREEIRAMREVEEMNARNCGCSGFDHIHPCPEAVLPT